jgi:hypothetical protein
MNVDVVAEVLDRVPLPFLPLKLAIIGVDVPGFPCFEPSVFGWREAMYGPLRSRNLWVPEGFGMTDGLLLEGNGFLNIMGGGGPNLGNCERGFNDGPMFYSPHGNRWGLTVTGHSVDANPRGQYKNNPLNHTWDIGEMFFGKWDNCSVNGSGGNNFNLHTDVQCLDFHNVISSDARGFGYRISRGSNPRWTGGAGAIERNGEGGILWEAGSDIAYTGFGTISTHFELNGGPAWDLRRIHSTSIKNNYVYASDGVHDAECRNLEITHNEFVSWGLDDDGFPRDRIIGPREGHTIGKNTYVRLNADGVTGEVYPDPDDFVQTVEKQFRRTFSLFGWTIGR